MWKWTPKDETKPGPPTPSAAPPVHSVPSRIGKSIAIKGELSGSESVYLDGELEGSKLARDAPVRPDRKAAVE
jgi:cytoskeletal protein CcmA (bactofilin family)